MNVIRRARQKRADGGEAEGAASTDVRELISQAFYETHFGGDGMGTQPDTDTQRFHIWFSYSVILLFCYSGRCFYSPYLGGGNNRSKRKALFSRVGAGMERWGVLR